MLNKFELYHESCKKIQIESVNASLFTLKEIDIMFRKLIVGCEAVSDLSQCGIEVQY